VAFVVPPQGVVGRWQESLPNGKIRCSLCPRECELTEGQRGYCFGRKREGDVIVLTSYGRASGFCIDPIEKKPLFHFYPGSSVLSFGTAGCNLGCRFCQNWELSKARDTERLSEVCTCEGIAETAQQWGCRSVAFTYNDPVVFAEFAIDTAKACRALGIKSVAVTAGYLQKSARKAFFEEMDATNVDLKAMTDSFYHDLCAAKLQPVVDTLRYLVHETQVWTEITTLLIPGYNDSIEEVKRLVDFVITELNENVPLHFTAFHGDYRMRDVPSTPKHTCILARETALRLGLKHVYTGNVSDDVGQNSYCVCGCRLVIRRGYSVSVDGLQSGRCRQCGLEWQGRFDPEKFEEFGPRRIPIRVPSRPQ
jgi:pyruvate formate lyase activating enzyme